ncbi:glycosyl hydrolase catalytic core-domain-containing protein [Tribonema minus]|uniref:Glycosyl hydrolase catalytic core-domain-containing protein n=1 Tax=Tribonema minus TaxID=303371 RepID=A0A835YYY4_9STRA|nr:glycosyl hydrolase catalytic core-domain-containing protein [Tribonema minus]KAG5180536.1 glycosyl hydrolase catalytic core-domain-containing protein [Tribonema minus]KAG5184206.1 glycosyl hydrolase catalytic core-domain-containing protein [Tribonema minus]KAG5188985.1 glycosyl hydrolase catalytic core-domain-containing protein [Tribonema minus]
MFDGLPPTQESHRGESRTLAANCTKSKKRGVSIDPRSSGDYFAREGSLLATGVRWYNNWNVTSQNATAFSRLAFMPMVWSRYGATHWLQAIQPPPTPGGPGSILLGFNEPNGQMQANMTPQVAASVWGGVLDRAKELDFKLASPSPTKKGYPAALLSGIVWLQQFFAEADQLYNTTNAGVHYINMHSYDCNIATVKDRIDLVSATFNDTRVIISEVGCAAAKLAGNATMMMDFMQQVVPMLEAHPRVAYYSWFNGLEKYAVSPASSSLFSRKNKLSALGLEYTKCVPKPQPATPPPTSAPTVVATQNPQADAILPSASEPSGSILFQHPREVQCLLDLRC